MPNWAYNVVKVKGALASEIKSAVGDDGNVFCLQKLMPMPKILESIGGEPASVIVSHAMAWAKKHNKACSAVMDAFIRFGGAILPDGAPISKEAGTYFRAIAETGCPSWYEWRCDNWWTKWDTVGARIVHETSDSVVFRFCTAWVPPVPVLVELSKRFPSAEVLLAAVPESDPDCADAFVLKNGRDEKVELGDCRDLEEFAITY